MCALWSDGVWRRLKARAVAAKRRTEQSADSKLHAGRRKTRYIRALVGRLLLLSKCSFFHREIIIFRYFCRRLGPKGKREIILSAYLSSQRAHTSTETNPRLSGTPAWKVIRGQQALSRITSSFKVKLIEGLFVVRHKSPFSPRLDLQMLLNHSQTPNRPRLTVGVISVDGFNVRKSAERSRKRRNDPGNCGSFAHI